MQQHFLYGELASLRSRSRRLRDIRSCASCGAIQHLPIKMAGAGFRRIECALNSSVLLVLRRWVAAADCVVVGGPGPGNSRRLVRNGSGDAGFPAGRPLRGAAAECFRNVLWLVWFGGGVVVVCFYFC